MRTQRSLFVSLCVGLFLNVSGCAEDGSSTEATDTQAYATNTSTDTVINREQEARAADGAVDAFSGPDDTLIEGVQDAGGADADIGESEPSPDIADSDSKAEEEKSPVAACDTSGLELAQASLFLFKDSGWLFVVKTTDSSSILEFTNKGETGLALEGATVDLGADNPLKLNVVLRTGCDLLGYCGNEFTAVSGTLQIQKVTYEQGGAFEFILEELVFSKGSAETLETCTFSAEYQGKAGLFAGQLKPFPEFSLPDQNGANVSLSDLKSGMGVVLFNLNAWCPPCIDASEAIDSVGESLNSADERFDVNVVQLLGEGGPPDFVKPASQQDATEWATETGTTLPVLHGAGVWDIHSALNVGGFFGAPAFWILDPNGIVVGFSQGIDTSLDVPNPDLEPDNIVALFEAFLEKNPDWEKEEGGDNADEEVQVTDEDDQGEDRDDQGTDENG